MKIKKKIIFTIIFLFTLISLGTIKSNAGSLNLNNLDFQVQINNDRKHGCKRNMGYINISNKYIIQVI